MPADVALDWLAQLTALPSAAGREQAVVAWLDRWLARRSKRFVKRFDRFGNVELRCRREAKTGDPLYFAAHMDHPAFVVQKVIDPRKVEAIFRGGVHPSYFPDTRVRLHHQNQPPQTGRVTTILHEVDKRYEITFNRNTQAGVGDVITWHVGKTRLTRDRIHTLACDNLAGVTAGLAAFDHLHTGRRKPPQPVRLLLTRAEEVGFIGAIAIAKHKLIPKRAWIIVLENSRSDPIDSPIGAGPIVRVGDRTSSFDAETTRRLSTLAEQLADRDDSFTHQRKLMPGGTCEATAYQALGYRAGCLCLPLGNYHNMDTARKRIAAETISLNDYRNLIALLVAAGSSWHDTATSTLNTRLGKLFQQHRHLLEPSFTCAQHMNPRSQPPESTFGINPR